MSKIAKPNKNLKLDIFPHIFPLAYFERMKKIAEGNPSLAAQLKRWMHIPVLWDLDKRIRMMKRFPGYQQVLTLSMPAVEFLGEARGVARTREARQRRHGRDRGASIPIFPRLRRLAADEQRAGGAGGDGPRDRQARRQGRADLHQRQRPAARRAGVFCHLRAHEQTHDLPVWMHPTRTAKFADYASEKKSKYEIWWLFGWPYETSAFMARLVFSGMLDKLPKLKSSPTTWARWCLTSNRIGYGMDQFGSRTSDEDYAGLLKRMKKRPLDYFKMFYGDTSINGSEIGDPLRNRLLRHGHVLFGTDCPFDPEGGPLFIRETIKALDGLKLKPEDRRRIYFGNALQMLKMK